MAFDQVLIKFSQQMDLRPEIQIGDILFLIMHPLKIVVVGRWEAQIDEAGGIQHGNGKLECA